MLPIELIIAAFLGIILLASVLSFRAHVPYTLVLVFVGIGLSATSASFYFGNGPVTGTVQQIVLAIRSISDQLLQNEGGASLFVGLIVPPLIFETMIHIRTSDLKAVIRPSLVLATAGVVISTVVGGLVLWKVAGLSLYVSFLFAALISPTDAATVLEVFRRAKVPTKLAALMDSEAAFNDATGIVVFSILLTSISITSRSLFFAAANFLVIFAGGAAVGLLVAFAAEVLGSLIQDKLAETILTISAVYGSYAVASSLGVSGLVAVAIVGLYFGNFTIKTAMGPATREAVTLFWEFAAFVGNSVAFLFIGFRTDIVSLGQAFLTGLVPIAFLAVTAARVASVYPIMYVDRIEKKKIPLKWMNVATLGGMRGALSIALASSISVSTLVASSDLNTINTMVLGVAFLSISLQAALLFRYIRRRFPEEQESKTVEALNVRLSRTLSAIESLEKLKMEKKISEEEFASQLKSEQDELREVLGEINSSVGTRNILRSRASELYASVVTLPMTRSMQILRLNRLSRPIENMIDKTTTTPNPREKEQQTSKKPEAETIPTTTVADPAPSDSNKETANNKDASTN